jgi:hypothetical protein
MKRTQVTGLLFLIGGVGLTIFNWHGALTYGKYHIGITFLAPLVACVGFSLLLYPPAQAAGGGVQQKPWKELPTGQKVLFGSGLALGAVNWVMISGILSTL